VSQYLLRSLSGGEGKKKQSEKAKEMDMWYRKKTYIKVNVDMRQAMYLLYKPERDGCKENLLFRPLENMMTIMVMISNT